MGLTDLLSNALILNRILDSQQRTETYMLRIAEAFERIADSIAPKAPEVTLEDIRQTSVSHIRDSEQARAEEFRESFYAKLGRNPSDEEITDFLDGKGPGGIQ